MAEDEQRLTKCPDCGNDVSVRAEACPKCGAPMREKVDVAGSWCPNCKQRRSTNDRPGEGFAVLLTIIGALATLAGIVYNIWLALIAFVLTIVVIAVWNRSPKRWTCLECRHVWMA